MRLQEKAHSEDHTKDASKPATVASKDFPRWGLLSTALVCVVCCGVVGCCQPNDLNCHNVSFGPSGAEVAVVALGVGALVATVVTFEVHHASHTIDGCVSNNSQGLQLKTHGGTKTYLLTGNTADFRAGERVRLHGSKVKQPKGNATDQTFLVESEKKAYGPCKP